MICAAYRFKHVQLAKMVLSNMDPGSQKRQATLDIALERAKGKQKSMLKLSGISAGETT